VLLVALSGCGSSDGELDPADLEVRDLLGLEPQIGLRWDAEDRADARRLLTGAMNRPPEAACDLTLGYGSTPGERALASLDMHDHDLVEQEAPPVMTARIETVGELDGTASLHVVPLAVDVDALLDRPTDPAAPSPHLVGWQSWPELAVRAPALLVELARAAGHPATDELSIEAAPRAPVAAAYLPAQRTLLVNPILLAALDPAAAASAASGGSAPRIVLGALPAVNPYNFYASLGDCTLDQQARCNACIASGGCDPESDAVSGLVECMTLTADPRGFALFCANLALAIVTVAECMAADAPTCPTVEGAGDQLSALQANAPVLDDPSCLAALNGCLNSIYGTGGGGSSADAGPTPPPRNATCTNCEGDCEKDCDDDCDNNGTDDCNAQCGPEGDTCTYNDCTCSNDKMGKTSCDGGGEDDSDCSCRGRDEMGNSSCTCGDGQDACTCTKDMNGQDKCSCGEPEGSTGGNEGRCATAPLKPRSAIGPALSLGVTVGWGVLPVGVLLVLRRRMRRRARRDDGTVQP
jgi:hypothetical protein